MSVVLVINPGSTSTKLALFRDSEMIGEHTIRHSPDELSKFLHYMSSVNSERP